MCLSLEVIAIIGILAAIAVPSFTNQANKAKESEVQQRLPRILTAQEIEYSEDSSFGAFDELSVNLRFDENNCVDSYCYEMTPVDPSGATTQVIISVTPDDGNTALRAFTGKTYLQTNTEGETSPTSFFCRSANATPIDLANLEECPE